MEIANQQAIFDRNVDVLRDRHLIAATLRDIEPKRHRAGLANRRAETRDTLESFAASFGLLRVLPRDVTANVVFFTGDHARLLVEGTLLRQPALRALMHEVLV